jgi:hypothetical protein
MLRTLTALAVLALLAGCTSSATGADRASSTPPSSSTPPAPTTSAASTPPTPTPSSSSRPPLSPFEADPAVKALRRWAVVAARTVNTGRYRSSELDALTARTERANMRYVIGGDVGLHYPGPIPFATRGVTVVNTAQRDVHICFIGTGFAIDPKTGKPRKFSLLPTKVVMKLQGGRWLAAGFQDDTVRCAGVKVPEVKW